MARRSWYALSISHVRFPVASDAILSARTGRRASGKGVLGVRATVLRLAGMIAVAIAGVRRDDEGVSFWRRAGSAGMAKAVELFVVSLLFVSAGIVAMNVNGLIGNGVSLHEHTSEHNPT